MCRRSVFVGLSAVLLAMTWSARARAADWTDWEPVSDEVSVSFKQMTPETWTWRFLNESTRTTVTHLSFAYTDKDGTHNDVLPFKLRPREHFGGWAAFTASSKPTIKIKEITRK